MDDNKENKQHNIQQPAQEQQNSAQAAPSGNKSNPGQQGPKPVVSLPKGGGAIKSIGEKFETNPVNGTYNMSVPLAISPGRGGFTPQLGLSYNSGGGNSPFGLGWNIGVPSITRKTDKSLPRYLDSEDSDTYILSGAEDLVPVDGGERVENGFDVKKYRPRTEGLFALIERWTDQSNGRIHWKSVSRENITSIYGISDDSCVIDPENSRRIFTWNLEKTFDAKGNLMEYGYKKEDNVGIAALDQKRNATQTYLKEVRYGNTEMHGSANYDTANKWLFRLVFDYGDHDTNNPAIDDNLAWPVRQDPFSTFRAGFDIRTFRLCKRVLMFHQFDDDLGATPVLVKATEFEYNENPFLTQLTKVTHRSYHEGQSETMPPVSFEYTEAPTGSRLHKVDPEHLDNMPHGPGSTWQWADLYGEGLQSLLHTSGNAWYIKPNLGDQTMLEEQVVDVNPDPQLKLGGMQAVKTAPHVTNQHGMSFHLSDVDSDSQPEIVVNAPQMNGFYSFENEQWQPFQSFKQYPNIDLNSPNTKMMELSGDGLADIIVSHGTFFEIYLSKGKAGYHPAMRIPTASTEEAGAKVVFADPQNSIHLADMSGDGLSDIVRIRHNSVCYWPNLGYGRFGKQVIMKNPPMLDSPDMFNNARVRLADVDGTGTTDIIYFNHKGAKFYKNQAGNGFSDAEVVSGFPAVDNLAQVEVMDLLGNGTSCMVWTSPLPNHTRQMYYIELTSGIKPYMLKSFTNGMGKETMLTYAPSTKFYLQDKANGKPWITKLPFPVQVLTRVETIEHVTGTKLVNKFAYHHGHYDTKEREFRGFGMVEQWDAETLTDAGTSPSGEAGRGDQPPVYTKSWFHTGFYKNRHEISTHFQSEYFSDDTNAWQLPDTVLPDNITPGQEAEACRALRGSLLRSEVYAQDGDAHETVPYVVEEKNYQLKLIQSKGNNKHAVWLKTEGEALSYHYERDTNDPRIQHSLTLETDAFGNTTKAATVAYPRRNISTIDGQNNTLVQYSETTFINEIDVNNNKYFIGVPCEAKSYEIKEMSGFSKITKSDITDAVAAGTNIELLAHSQNYFTVESPDYTTGVMADVRLALGEIASHGLPYRSYNLALTDAINQKLLDLNIKSNDPTAYYNDQLGNKSISNLSTLLLDSNTGKYQQPNGDTIQYWAQSEMQEFDTANFCLPVKMVDPMDNKSSIEYDAYNLLVIKSIDAEGYESVITNNYTFLQPEQIKDVNENVTSIAFNALGLVSKLALQGKETSAAPLTYEGDTLDDPTQVFIYNLNEYEQNGTPNYVRHFQREKHGAANATPWPDVNTANHGMNNGWMESITYMDGMGNEIATKVQAEDGKALQLTGTTLALSSTDVSPRWAVNGRVILNNKGKAWKQFEPYFTDSHEFDNFHLADNALDFVKNSAIVYDPVGRPIRTDMPDGTFTKVEFDPWKQENWDANDTVFDSQWYSDRNSPDPAGAEPEDKNERAAFLSAQHANTPKTVHFDVLGRAVQTDDYNLNSDGTDDIVTTKLRLDIKGNVLEMTDALGIKATQNRYNLLGQPIYTHNVDTGRRFMLSNNAGQPYLLWDNRNHQVENWYDNKMRPTTTHLKTADGEKIIDKKEYADIPAQNTRNQLYRAYDQAGMVQFDTYDFRGNPTTEIRFVSVEHTTIIDHSETVPYDTTNFVNTHSFDAMGRMITEVLPDNTIQQFSYNKAGLLEKVEAKLRGVGAYAAYISNINYNARGQRTEVYFGNNTKTKYEYDENNFRLTRLLTTRNSGTEILQDLNYTYDAVGNIVEIVDNAQQTHYFSNTVIEPKGKYWYDALYRLVKATGRENEAIAAAPGQADLAATTGIPYNNGTNHLKNYTQTFEYDKLGNISAMKDQGNWTRNYYYDAVKKNRLISHDDVNQTIEYTYDAHGNMLSMPGIPTMQWDYADQLHKAISGTSTAFYNYDVGGNRMRKVVEKQDGSKEVRIYIGNFEIYRKFDSNEELVTERKTVFVTDGDKRIATIDTLTVDNKVAVGTLVDLIRYQYDNHLGSASLELDENAATISYEEYHPFGTSSYRLHSNSTEVSRKRYRYVGKERDEETGLYYYGARYYAAWIGRFCSVDPMAHEREWLSPYNYCQNNPINRIDPDGALDDWFENEITGDVYYNSDMRKGDEGTGAMTGEGWKHMGENNMFSDGSPMTSDASILMGNQGLGKTSITPNYDKSQVYADAKVTSVTMTGMFKGGNAKKLMGGLGYDFKPVLFKFHSDVTTEYHPEVNGQVTISHDNSRVESVLSSRYISQDLVLKNTLTLSDYKAPIYGKPKSFGPMYSIRNQSWTNRKNVYGTHAFGRKFGKTINTLQKIVPWKGAYENMWKKALK